MPTPEIQNDFFAGSVPVPAGPTLEVDIATAARVGLDGASVIDASVDESGELLLILSNGIKLNAGRVTGTPGLTGIAHPDTIPRISTDPQLYIAVGKGVYGYFRNRWDQPVRIDRENSIVFLYSPAGSRTWEASEMTMDLTGYARQADLTFLSTEGPVFSCYPPATEPVEGLYDPATGRFRLPEGATTVTSQDEVFGNIVYTGCSHIMLGFNLEYAIYLETATGRCLCMDVRTKETHYHSESFAPQGIARKYVRVNTVGEESMTIEIEQSDDGYRYVPYARVDRGARPGLFITYRTIGFYQPGAENTARILSVGRGNRLMLDRVPVLDEQESQEYEVLSPSDNYAGIVRRKVVRSATGGMSAGRKPFAGKRIVLYGDQITIEQDVEPGTYAGFVKQKFGAAEVTNRGVSETLSGGASNRLDSLTHDPRIDGIVSSGPDLVILMAGTNDYWYEMPLGDLYGDLGNAAYIRTVTGGLRYLLDRLTRELPDGSRVLFCTPPPGFSFGMPDTVPNSAGLRMSDYVQRFKTVCAEYHVPVCDVWANAGWSAGNEIRRPRYTTDGLQLSVEGYDRLTDLLQAEAERYG